MIRGLRVDGVGYNVLRVPVALSASAFTPCGRRWAGCGVCPLPRQPVFLLDKDYYDRHDERSSSASICLSECMLSIHARHST